ncbi:RagB/SusD family nutrient uptake outer membrane protein [Maribellus luteus]|uniref:RagB/SusD family nutrient uptake outer membrane protein n=1 Tax=Maribellus luteus TaxID=2305463 RepID=A0A399SQU5_9BACT|nr:RagB/SusD family nutrient uptake outer membrane protein [Maribellus luteus]RIJ45748.1 RagB/SusD family nutrient uptake outer membrane protein [Maribellus luteus]
MKKLKNYILLFLMMFAFGACDYLDIVPDNVATIDNAFTDKYNAEKYLFTCYSYLPKMGSTGNNPAILGSDELSLGKYHENTSGVQLSIGNQTIVAPYYDFWRGTSGGTALYTGVRDCNTFLERIGEVPDISDYERNIWIAEVKFIKAYLHFYLIRMYGPIHIIPENLPVNESIENLKLTREPLDDCFKYVIDLIDEAMVDLPEILQVEATDYGHITKPIAAAVKAKILVTAASPLFNGEAGFNIYNHDGTALFPTEDATAIQQKWADALTACEEAISLAENAGHRLMDLSDFKTAGAVVTDTTKLKVILNYRVTAQENQEVIWPHTNGAASVGGLQSIAMPAYFSTQDWYGDGSLGAPLKMSLLHYTNNGVPIEEDKDWQGLNLNKIMTVGADQANHMKLGHRTVQRNFNREVRYYADLSFDGALVYGHLRPDKTDNNAALDYINHKQGGWSSSGYAWKVCPYGYWPVKLVNMNTGQDNMGWRGRAYAFPALRLADLYLLYAETLIENNQLDEAKVWIDKIRTRAGLKGIDESWAVYSTNPSKPDTKDGLREIMKRERLIELAFEGSRFWDLRRWMDAEDYCNEPVTSWNPNESTVEGYYNVQVVYYPTFNIKHHFFPIAESEISKNPNLVQNYGW